MYDINAQCLCDSGSVGDWAPCKICFILHKSTHTESRSQLHSNIIHIWPGELSRNIIIERKTNNMLITQNHKAGTHSLLDAN